MHSFKLEPDESFKLMSYGSLLSQRAKICNRGLLDNLAKYLFIFLLKAPRTVPGKLHGLFNLGSINLNLNMSLSFKNSYIIGKNIFCVKLNF